jgi:hypothetical protein
MSDRQQQRRARRRRKHSERSSTRRLVAAGGLTAGATLAMAGSAQAAPMTFTVGSTADTATATDCDVATNTDCTLRDAIIAANANSGADTIVFKSGVTGTITMTANPETVTEALTVQGPGSADITVDGDATYRTFYIDPTTPSDPVSISGLTLTNGYVVGYGGAIYNIDADLTISNTVVSGSATGAGQSGGGIGSGADLTVTDSTMRDNYAGRYGGGINITDGDLIVRGSTITGNNAAEDGGGIYSASGGVADAVNVRRSTVSGNHAIGDDGGGVWVCCGTEGATLTVVGSTITGNTAATYGGGLNAYLEDPVLQGSIVSGNTATPAVSSDIHETYVSGYFQTAFSLVGIPGGYVEATVPSSNLFGVNPQLGPLTSNGGPTETRLPATTSPVVNKGKSFGLTTDQRGLTRPVAFPGVANSTAAGADGADMGAVELQAPSPPPPPGPTPTPPANPGATGQRDAALKKCKKKHKKAVASKRAHDALTKPVKQQLAKKFKKCKRKANQLPV